MNVHILSFIQVDTCRTLSSKASLRRELSANPIVTISFVSRCSLFTGVQLWLLEYHSLLLTQTIHYITTNHHAVQVNIAREMSMNAGNRNHSDQIKWIMQKINTLSDALGCILTGYFGRLLWCLLVGGGIVWLTHNKRNIIRPKVTKITSRAAFNLPNHKAC